MAVSPLHPAAVLPLPVAPSVAAPAAPTTVDLSLAVKPAAEATDSNGARDATADSRQPPQEPLEKALEDINEQMKAWSTQLQFDIDPEINRVVVSVVDSATGDVMRTIPSDAVLRIAKMIVKLQGNAVETSA